jgi:hypothetical protein
MMKRILIVCLAGVVFSAASFAGGAGTTGAQFLKVNLAAKPMGMGGAYGAVSGDINGIVYNPAALAGIAGKEIGMTLSTYFEDVTAGLISAALPTENGALGVGITYLSVGNIEKRAGDTAAADGTFGNTNTMVTVSYAKKDLVMDGVTCGANLKLISETIDTSGASAVALDLAGLYAVGDNIVLGANLQNLGTGIQFTASSDPLPLNLKLSVSYKGISKLLLAADVDCGLSDSVYAVAVGGQFMFGEMFGLRLGYKTGYNSLGSMAGLSLGAGLSTEKIGVDLAFVPFGDLGNSIKLSFDLKF